MYSSPLQQYISTSGMISNSCVEACENSGGRHVATYFNRGFSSDGDNGDAGSRFAAWVMM